MYMFLPMMYLILIIYTSNYVYDSNRGISFKFTWETQFALFLMHPKPVQARLVN